MMESVFFEGSVGLSEADLLEAGPRDGAAHNLLFVHELCGTLDVDRLAQAAHWVAGRHENFRTGFVRTEAGWRRRVYAAQPRIMEIVDLRAEADPEQAARARVAALLRTPFDRAVPPLVRVALLQLTAERFWFVSYTDHLALDGVAYTTCLTELVMAYSLLSQGQTPALPPPRQPREHVAAMESVLDAVRAAPGPWCAPYPEDGFALPAAGDDRAGARCFVTLGDPHAVDALARAEGVARSAPIVAAMALGLRALAERADVAFTLIRSGRRDAAARGIMGCLAWGDAWSVRVEADEPLRAVLARAHAFLQDTAPWRMLYIPTVNPPSRRVVLNINRFHTTLQLPDLTVFPRLDVAPEVVMWSSHDLLVQVFPLPGALQAVVRYRTALIPPALAERFAAAMSAGLRALVADPAAPVRAVG